jgi:hypothetical protein
MQINPVTLLDGDFPIPENGTNIKRHAILQSLFQTEVTWDGTASLRNKIIA